MTRRPALAALALVAFSLSLPQTAAAEKTMCTVRGAFAALDGSELGAPRSARSPQVVGASSAASAVGLAVPAHVVEVLWCASPDDPRCAPARSGSGSRMDFSGGGLVFVVPATPPRVANAPVSSLRNAPAGGGAQRGVTGSLDRPPR